MRAFLWAGSVSEIVLFMDAPSIAIYGGGGVGVLQQGTKTVNERSSSQITAVFLDPSLVENAPDSARYRIDDITNGRREILDWTAIAAPSATETITITAVQNRILGDGNHRELRQVTVEATESSEPFREVHQYEIKNLFGTDNDT